MANISDVDLSRLGVTKFGSFTVEVVDPVSDYLELLEVIMGLIDDPSPCLFSFEIDDSLLDADELIIFYHAECL